MTMPMNIRWNKVVFSLSMLVMASTFVGCSSGNCRAQKELEKENSNVVEPIPALPQDSQKHIKVFKYDGSKQCGIAAGTPAAEMQKELAGIKIYKAENKMDGLMHMQACGTNTGRANVYEIDPESFEEAKKKGFREWVY